MTILVGLLCQNGVVIGADSSATQVAGNIPTIEQPTHKIKIISGKIIVACTGSVGLAQRFSAVVEQASEAKLFSKDTPLIEIGKQLCAKGIQDFRSTSLNPGGFGALVGFPWGTTYQLCELEAANFQPELKDQNMWYVSMGSGQLICDSFLGFLRRVLWKDGKLPKLNEGTFAAAWTLQHAVNVNPGGIKDPIEIAILETTRSGVIARMLDDSDTAEHCNNVAGLEDYIGKYPLIIGEATASVPEVEKPKSAVIAPKSLAVTDP